MIAGKSVLVTGGGGSVGGFLVRRLLERDPTVVRILDNSEPGLATLRAEIDDERCRYLAGDVRDKERLARAIEDIDYVVHTAGMKHVEICEYNPFEAVKTNVVGLQNLIDVSIDADVERFVFTSSDKAAHPANTMGTTKLLGEKLVTAANKYSGEHDIRLASVRFGNVVNSSQSVIPVFREQIRDGGPVTVTDPRMTRFFLTYDDVTELVVSAMDHSRGGEVFIRKMDAIRIRDLADAMIEVLAPVFDLDPVSIEISETGPRLGETFHEEILTERERGRTTESDDMYAIMPEQSGKNGFLTHDGLPGFESVEEVVRSSEEAPKLTKAEIIESLKKEFQRGIG